MDTRIIYSCPRMTKGILQPGMYEHRFSNHFGRRDPVLNLTILSSEKDARTVRCSQSHPSPPGLGGIGCSGWPLEVRSCLQSSNNHTVQHQQHQGPIWLRSSQYTHGCKSRAKVCFHLHTPHGWQRKGLFALGNCACLPVVMASLEFYNRAKLLDPAQGF